MPRPADKKTAFERKLVRGGASIKKAAGDRRCGDCANAIMHSESTGICGANENVEGESLRIYRVNAYACIRFKVLTVLQ